jgi:hypothetical protein
MNTPTLGDRPQTRTARPCRRILWTAIAVVVVVAIVVTAAALRLSQGPIAIDLLREGAQTRLARFVGREFAVEVGDGLLGWSQGGFAIIFRHVKLNNPFKGIEVTVDEVRLYTSVVGVVLGGRDIHTVEINSPRMRIPTHQFEIDQTGEPANEFIPSLAISRADRLVADILERASGIGLVTVSLFDGRIDIVAPGFPDLQQARTIDSIDLEMRIPQNDQLFSINLTAAGRSGRWSARMFKERDAHDTELNGGHRLVLSGTDITLSDFLVNEQRIRRGSLTLLRHNPTYQATFDAEGDLLNIDARVVVRAGTIGFGRDQLFALDEAHLNGLWERGRTHFVVQQSSVYFGDTRFLFTGTFRPPKADGSPMVFAFEVLEGQIAPPDVAGMPLYVDNVTLGGSYDPATSYLEIDEFTLKSGAATVALAANAQFSPAGPLLVLAAQIGSMSVATLKRLWPSFIAPNIRQWVIENVKSGHIRSASIDAALGPDAIDPRRVDVRGWPNHAVKLAFQFDRATINTIAGLPPVTGASGKGWLKAGAFVVDIEGGTLASKSGRTGTVEQLVFTIPDVRPYANIGIIKARIAGSAATLAEISDVPPFNAMQEAKIKPDTLSGSGTARIQAKFPVDGNTRLRDIDWSVEADLVNFSSSRPIEGRMLKDGQLKIHADANLVQVRGTAEIDGYKVEFDLEQPLKGSSGAPAQRKVTLTLNDAERRKKGINLEPILVGRVDVVVADKGDKGQHLTVDLTKARLTIPFLGWSKVSGIPGTAMFRLIADGGGWKVEDLDIVAQDLRIKGRAVIDADGHLVSATLSHFALQETDRASLTISAPRRGMLKIQFVAQDFNGRALISQLKSDVDPSELTTDFEVTGRIKRLRGFDDVDADAVTFSAVGRAGKVTGIKFGGDMGGPVSLTLTSSDGARKLEVDAADTGAVLRFIQVYERMTSGALRVRATLLPGGTARGQLVINRFKIIEDPALRQLVNTYGSSARTRGGAEPEIAPNAYQGYSEFDRLDARFHYAQGVLSIGRARIYNPVIGVTVDGRIDMARQEIAFQGTFLPIYGLNNLFGRIPLLGAVLGAGRRGGLLGITFKVTGPVDKPVLQINPLSAVAPGVLRKFFEYRQQSPLNRPQ